MRPWHYHYSPEVAAILPRYRCWALIDGVLREYTQASIVPLSGAGVYLGWGGMCGVCSPTTPQKKCSKVHFPLARARGHV